MKKLEKILAQVFTLIMNDINGDIDHISEWIKTKEVIDLCEELNLNDFKEKLINLEKAYEDDDYDKINEIYRSFPK